MYTTLRLALTVVSILAAAGSGLVVASPATAATTAALTGTIDAPRGVVVTRLNACAYRAPASYTPLAPALGCTKPDAKGHFTIRGLPIATTVIIAVENHGDVDPAVGAWFIGGTAIPFLANRFSTDNGTVGTATTLRSGALSVTVSDGQRGSVQLLKANGEPITSKPIPSNGTVTFRHLYPGTYRVKASAKGTLASTTRAGTIAVSSNATSHATFGRPRGGVVTGIVRDQHKHVVAFVPVALRGLDGHVTSVTANASGRYTFRHLTAGSYTLTINGGADKGNAYLRTHTKTVAVKLHRTTTYSLRLAPAGAVSVSGTSGRHISLIARATGNAITIDSRPRSVFIGHLIPGTYSLADVKSSGSGETVGSRNVAIVAERVAKTKPATVRTAGTIVTGTAPKSLSELQPTVVISASPAEAEFGLKAWADIHSGTFRASPLPPGDYTIRLVDEYHSYPTHRIHVGNSAATYDLSHDKPTSRAGYAPKLLSLHGVPIAGHPTSTTESFSASSRSAVGDYRYYWRKGATTSTFFVHSASIPPTVPAYFSTASRTITRSMSIAVTGIVGD